jgi:hypothetical protein
MDLSSTSEHGFTFNGTCPHCGKEAAFPSVTQPFDESSSSYSHREGDRKIAALRCIACSKYILGIIRLNYSRTNDSHWWEYESHYPLDKPNDAVSEDIPVQIRLDFQEALRCQWVEAYNATVEMCRRAIEGTCLEKGVPDNIRTLQGMIDSLKDQEIITPGLQRTAHKVRLGGDRGAHPPQGIPPEKQKNEEGKPIQRIEKEHAEAVVGFTEHFLHHVYVVPKQLDKYDFSRTKPDKNS